MKKEDQRSRLTKLLIENAFIDLLQTKNLSSISVKEVCDKAMINRSTFYSYYLDIFDLYNSIKEMIKNVIKNKLESYGKFDKNFNLYEEILSFFVDYKDVVKIFLAYQVDSSFITEMMVLAEDKVFEIYKEKFPLINEKKFRDYFTFTSNGCLGIITKWVKNGMKEDSKEIAKIMESISLYGIKYLY